MIAEQSPRTSVTLVVCKKRRAMVDHGTLEFRGGESSTRNPAGKLIVPDTVVPTKELSISLCQIQDRITGCESKGTLSRLCRVLKITDPRGSVSKLGHCEVQEYNNGVHETTHPLPAVSRRDLSKHRVIT